ncbi:MAG: pirin family protein [Bacteroidia bacterium]|nr:pirin family protein [Bacteroidia bacterium]MBT8269905.1 pirin family protein [Bacteroidia bacterium]NNF82306.1 pirin family protein [Flavobacteriaceae bacterium]NNK69930.1 pirin family protein [Flavobacteriaceae bacterium]NNL80153.1 pirin family protein [Flavobacteriaceae bacterium]
MKTVVHKADSRGFANHGWLQANHSFSFANYFNPEKIHFGALRVLNDDIIAPSMGFSTHPHNNMEIITIPLSGELKHKDSMFNDWQSVRPGEVQVMSAGTGVFHSEINGSSKEYLSLFQIWITPDQENVEPRYDQKIFNPDDRKNKIQTLVSGFDVPDSGSLKIHQSARLSRIDLEKEKMVQYKTISENHGVYVMVIHGELELNGQVIQSRDAAGISESSQIEIEAKSDSEVLLIEVPMINLN